MRRSNLLVLAIAMASPLTASAATHIKPGEWSITQTTDLTKGGPQLAPDQANLPPALMQRFRQAAARMPAMLRAPHTHRQCITPEDAAKWDHPDPGDIGNQHCQLQNASWSGNHFHGEASCPTTNGQASGTIDVTMTSDESYTADMHVTGNDPEMGGDFALDTHMQGTWVGARCDAEN